ncbi:hypothetical protein LCGC14_2311920, partial [marine sediment metagenome]
DKGQDNADRASNGRFRPGCKGGPGKPAGTKDGASLLRSALAALDAAHPEGAQGWLEEQAERYPKEFLGFIKAILPRDSKVTLEQEITVNDWIARMARSA